MLYDGLAKPFACGREGKRYSNDFAKELQLEETQAFFQPRTRHTAFVNLT